VPQRLDAEFETGLFLVRELEHTGLVRYPWRDGTTHVAFTGVELLEKLAVLTPAPRGNITRYPGVLAPGAKSRSTVVRERTPSESSPRVELPPPGKANGGHASQATVPVLEVAPGDPVSLRERRLSWSEGRMRVFNEDVLECKRCGGRAEVISAITQPKMIEAILTCLGHTVRAPPIAPSRLARFDF
jgi:hypothetical protein